MQTVGLVELVASATACKQARPSMPTVRDQFNRTLHDLRISVTDRCNFRCPYCMPKEVFGPGYPFLKDPQQIGRAHV